LEFETPQINENMQCNLYQRNKVYVMSTNIRRKISTWLFGWTFCWKLK